MEQQIQDNYQLHLLNKIHIYFQILIQKVIVDPLYYLKKKQKNETTIKKNQLF